MLIVSLCPAVVSGSPVSKKWILASVLSLFSFGIHLTFLSIKRGTWGFAVLQCCSVFCIPVNKIPHCGIAVISKPTVCDVCAFQPMVSGKTKLFAVLRHQQYQHSLRADHAVWTIYVAL